ncbi:MAG: response regulator [Candidatus Tectimicrobiota bacterium]
MPENRPATIMLIEDDPGHARLIERNLRRAQVVNEILLFADGQQAVQYLFHTRAYAQSRHPLPLLVLLDLNLPGLDGYQILAQLKGDHRTKHIPVIVLTTTDEPKDIERCYNLGCNVYMTKSVEYAKFARAIQSLGLFLSVVKIPNGV